MLPPQYLWFVPAISCPGELIADPKNGIFEIELANHSDPSKMIPQWPSILVSLVSILSITALSYQTVFDKKLVQRRPDVTPPRSFAKLKSQYQEILSHHAHFDDVAAQRRENARIETLAFVTPWNNRGYDIVILSNCSI